jgi:hypothetical protein
VNPPADWYREAHGALDVVLDDFIQSYGKVNPRLWQQLDEILGFLHTWWDQADVQSAGNLSRSMSGRWIQAGPNPREHFHQLLDTSIRNSLGDILAGYQQSNQSSWIVDHGSEISRAISFTSPEEFNLEGEWAGRWGLPSRDGVGESIGGVTTFLRPDGSGERSGRPMSNVPLARDPVYPYDRPITYGTQRYRTADGPIESPQPNTAWEELEESLASGDMGTDGLAPDELELDVLRNQFRRMFDDSLADVQGFDSPSLFVLLADLDPDFAAQTFAPEDDSEMASIYNAWGAHVVGPEEER